MTKDRGEWWLRENIVPADVEITPNVPERTLTFNFTISEWRALTAAAALGARRLNPDKPSLPDQVYGLCKRIAEGTGAFDEVGRERK